MYVKKNRRNMYQILNNCSKNMLRKYTRSIITGRTIIQTRCCSSNSEQVTEALIEKELRIKFPGAMNINVEDTSGGCGAMFNVAIETAEFKGLSIMKQHRIVYDALKDQITKIHGLHLQTKAPI